MNKLFVWLVGLLAPVWTRLGADPRALKLILAAKLKMDDRGGLVMQKRQGNGKGAEYMMYVFVLLFGLFFLTLFSMTDDYATAVGIGYCVWVCYLGLLLITEMSENLFDQRDLYVLLSRPISGVTLSLSRMLHIAVFASKFALCLGVPTFVGLIFMAGPWAAFAYFLTSVVAMIMILTGTLVLYLVLLQNVPPERLKKVLGYFQIVATFILFMSYQLPSLMGDVKAMENISLVDTPWGFAFPGLWLGGLYKLLSGTPIGPWGIGQAVLAFGAAAAGLWFYINQSRGYADRLLDLKGAGSEAGASKESKSGESTKSPVRDALGPLLTAPNQERTSFNFHWNVMARDMTFKQRVLPSLVYLPVLLAISVFRDVFKGEEAFAPAEGTMLLLLYFLMWMIVIPLGQTKVSENYRASWIFEATANAYPERINYGQLMAVLGMFFFPMAILVYAVVLGYWGIGYWLDVVLALGNTLFFSMLYNRVDQSHPFSRAKEDSKFKNFLPFLVVGSLGTAFGFAHWAVRWIPYVLPAATVVVWAVLLGWLWWMRKR